MGLCGREDRALRSTSNSSASHSLTFWLQAPFGAIFVSCKLACEKTVGVRFLLFAIRTDRDLHSCICAKAASELNHPHLILCMAFCLLRLAYHHLRIAYYHLRITYYHIRMTHYAGVKIFKRDTNMLVLFGTLMRLLTTRRYLMGMFDMHCLYCCI